MQTPKEVAPAPVAATPLVAPPLGKRKAPHAGHKAAPRRGKAGAVRVATEPAEDAARISGGLVNGAVH